MNGAVSKTVVRLCRTEGSNPSPSVVVRGSHHDAQRARRGLASGAMRALRLLAVTIVALVAFVPAAARADDQVPMKVTFEANGTWTVDRHDVSPDDCGDLSTHGVGTLGWTAT